MSESSVATIKRLQGLIQERLSDLIDPAGRYALLDFPNHHNIGDSAIWLGELAYLEKRGMRPSFVSEIPTHRDDRMEAAIGDGHILLSGGGNFGDVWPGFREFREGILERQRGRPIIQLPQTLQFNSQDAIDTMARAIERHGRFTLLVRDTRSLEFAQRWFQCETRLCPDMAFCIGPLQRSAPKYDLLLNLRDDHEAGARHDTSAAMARPNVYASDWPAEDHHELQKRTKRSAVIKALLRGNVGGRAKMTELTYRERAEFRFQRGIDLLSSAKQLITDRMHGHIMSLLIDADHCVFDNSYGKTSGLVNTWGTCNGTRAALVGSMDEALAELDARRSVAQAA